MKAIYERDVKARLTTLDAQIADLAEKIDRAGADVQGEYAQTLTRLERKRDEIHKRFTALENASESAWSELNSGFNEALAVFTQSVEDAGMHFNAERTKA